MSESIDCSCIRPRNNISDLIDNSQIIRDIIESHYTTTQTIPPNNPTTTNTTTKETNDNKCLCKRIVE